MLTLLRPALTLLTAFMLLTGIAYPLAITGIAQVAVPGSANGSLIERDGTVVGSALIGQNFASERYFHGRPSATSAADPADASKTIDAPYNAAASTGSNHGPSSQKLVDAIRERAAALGGGQVPADLVTASASGLDPDISPAGARFQLARVARARGLEEATVAGLVEQAIEGRSFGMLGEPRVNVLKLNLALDALKR